MEYFSLIIGFSAGVVVTSTALLVYGIYLANNMQRMKLQ